MADGFRSQGQPFKEILKRMRTEIANRWNNFTADRC